MFWWGRALVRGGGAGVLFFSLGALCGRLSPKCPGQPGGPLAPAPPTWHTQLLPPKTTFLIVFGGGKSTVAAAWVFFVPLFSKTALAGHSLGNASPSQQLLWPLPLPAATPIWARPKPLLYLYLVVGSQLWLVVEFFFVVSSLGELPPADHFPPWLWAGFGPPPLLLPLPFSTASALFLTPSLLSF